jgi:hypothetical protein
MACLFERQTPCSMRPTERSRTALDMYAASDFHVASHRETVPTSRVKCFWRQDQV